MAVDWRRWEQVLRDGFAKGDSASQIADRIPEATRASVSGKLHRLGLTRPDSPFSPEGRKARTAAQASADHAIERRISGAKHVTPWGAAPELRKPPTPIGLDRALPATARPFLERGGLQCRWPYETTEGWWSCCAKVEGAGPYCPDHTAAAYAGRVGDPLADRRKRRAA